MREDRAFLVSLKESEIILISGALAQIAEARSELADQPSSGPDKGRSVPCYSDMPVYNVEELPEL
jgi:hypothetical protein